MHQEISTLAKMRAAFPLILVTPWITYSDLRFRRIPNPALLLLLALIELESFVSHLPFPSSRYLLALWIFLGGWITRFLLRGAIGMGDVKLFALSSLLCGTVERAFATLLLASILGLIGATIARRRVIPFAPALFSGALLVLFSG